MLSFRCEFCRKEFLKDESLAGRKGRCTQCGHVFIIPGKPARPATSVREASPSIRAVYEARAEAPVREPRATSPRPLASPTPPRPAYAPPPKDPDPFGINDLPPRMPMPVASVEEADVVLPWRAGMGEGASSVRRKKARRRDYDFDLFDGLPEAVYLVVPLVLAAAYVLALTRMIPAPTGGLIFAALAGCCALLFILYGQIGLLVWGFRGGLLNGLMCWFCPFYILFFVIREWDTVRGVFLSHIAGIVLAISTGVLLPSLVPVNPGQFPSGMRQEQFAPFDDDFDGPPAAAPGNRPGPR